MTTYILRRLLLMFPTLIGITAVVFFTMAFSPGAPSSQMISKQGNLKPSERKALTAYLNQRYGLDKPKIVQYFKWLNLVSPVGMKDRGSGFPGAWGFGFKWPDLGESFIRGRPVLDLILEALPITVLLNAVTIPIMYLISLAVGLQAARRRGEFTDIASGTVLIALWSFPSILAGVLMIAYLADKEHIYWFPSGGLHDVRSLSMAFLPSMGPDGFHRGWLLDTAWHLVLPVVCLTYGSFAFLAKLERTAVLESLSSDFVRTARAKGVSEWHVLMRHAFRNSLLPLITVSAGILPGLLGGSVIVERIFNLNGMGNLMVTAAFVQDRDLVLGDALIIGILGLIAYLIADLGYALADPRVSYE